jgi:hypothetical protein
MRSVNKVSVEDSEEKRLLGRPKRRWVYDIKNMDLKEIGWKVVNSIHLAQNVETMICFEHCNISSGSIMKGWEFLE